MEADGVRVIRISEKEALGINLDGGMRITSVVKGSAGEGAGLRARMRIVGVNGKAVSDVGDVKKAMENDEGELQLHVEEEEGSETASTYVDDECATMDGSEDWEGSEHASCPVHTLHKSAPEDEIGMQYSDTMVITRVDQGSLASCGGLEVGMTILLVNRAPVTPDSLRKLLSSGLLTFAFTVSTSKVALPKKSKISLNLTGIGKKLTSLAGDQTADSIMLPMNKNNGLTTISYEGYCRVRRDTEAFKRRVAELQGKHQKSVTECNKMREFISSSQTQAETLNAEWRKLMDLINRSKLPSSAQKVIQEIQEAEEKKDADLADFMEKQAVLKAEFKQLRAENDELQERVNELPPEEEEKPQEQEQTETQQKENLEKLISGAEEELKHLEKEQEGNLKKISLFEGLIQQTQHEADHQKQVVAQREQHIEELRKTNTQAREDRTAMTLEVQKGQEQLEKTVNSLMAKVKEAGNEKDKHIAKASEELIKKQEEENDLHTKLKDAENEIEAFKLTNTTLAKANSELKTAQAEYLSRIEELDKRLADINDIMSSCNDIEQDRDRRKAEMAVRETQVSELRELNKKLTEEAETSEKDLKELTKKFQEAEQINNIHRDTLAKGAARLCELEPLDLRVTQLQEQLEEESCKRDTERGVCYELLDNIDTAAETLQELEASQAQAEKEAEVLEEQTAAYMLEVESFSDQFKTVIAKHQKNLAECKAAQKEELNTQTSNIKQLQRKLASTEGRYKDCTLKMQKLEANLRASGGSGKSIEMLQEENSELLKKVARQQSRLRSTELGKKASQATLKAKQIESLKKDTVLSRYVTPSTSCATSFSESSPKRFLSKLKLKQKCTPHMQHVIEELLYENSNLIRDIEACKRRLQEQNK